MVPPGCAPGPPLLELQEASERGGTGSNFFQVLFRGWRATQRPRPSASRLLVIIVVTATALARKNGATTFVNFSVRARPLGKRGSLHLCPSFLSCKNCSNCRKALNIE